MTATVVCKYCEATNAANAKFCGRCGKPLADIPPPSPPPSPRPADELICPNCSRPNPPGSSQCRYCGARLTLWKPARRRKRRLGCLSALLLLTALAAAALFALPRLGVALPEPVAGLLGAPPSPAPRVTDDDTPDTTPETASGVETAIVQTAEPTSRPGDIPTVTPFPTGTPRPMLAPLPGMTSPPDTPTPVVPADPFNLAGESALKVINQPWEQDGVSLTARTIEIWREADGDTPAARVWFRLVNKTGDRILVEIDWNNIHLEDSFGTRYVDYYGGGTTSEWVEPGANFDFDRHYSAFVEQPSRVPGDATYVQVVVDSFSRVQNARWQFDINPALKPVAVPEAGTTKPVGAAWEKDGITLQLTDLRVHDDREGDAAARAWFALTNTTNQVALVEVDYGRIYLLDGYGRRFGDWDGGGVVTHSIDPGRSIEFDRYYSAMSGRFSRVTRGAKHITVVVDHTGGQDTALWTLEINSRLSDGAAPVAPLIINQPWEQDGLSLTARAIGIRGQDDGGAAAAQVWYRLVNKTGDRILVDVDWSAIHLEDSLDTVYGDYYGQELTSFWLEPGAVFDFDRHYSAVIEQESRIPAETRFVAIVVDSFSRIRNARWQRNMTAELRPLEPPAPDRVRAIGEGWEQGGLLLRLTNLEVRSESDGDSAAFRAWYEIANTSSLPILVEVDFGQFYLTDSFGGHFGDWEGGGLLTQWIGPGESLEFDRYYSEMAGQPGRITRGSEFVLMRFENLTGISSGVWRMDIAR